MSIEKETTEGRLADIINEAKEVYIDEYKLSDNDKRCLAIALHFVHYWRMVKGMV